MSDYRSALDRTSDVLGARAKGYRNLVVSFLVISLSSVSGAIGLLSLRPASGLLLVVPTHAIFLWSDCKVLRRWRGQLGEAWASKKIDFSAFRHALKANPALPQRSVRGMLDTLPETGNLQAEQAVGTGTRKAVVCALTARDECHTTALACRAVAYGIVAVAVIPSFALWAWQPLLAIGLVLVPVTACECHRRRRIAHTVTTLRHLRERDDFDADRYRQILTSLDWHGLSQRDRERLTVLSR